MKRFLLASLAVLFLVLPMLGCSTTGGDYEPPAVCFNADGSQADSAILNHMADPRAVKTTIVAAVQAAVIMEKISPGAVLKVCASARAMLEAGNTYSGLVSWLTGKVDSAKLAAVLALVNSTELLDQLAAVAGDISACDNALLLRLVEAVEDAVEPLE